MPRHRRLLTWDTAAVPEGGAAVYAQMTALAQSWAKEPAGHIHLVVALKQAGLYGERAVVRRGPRAWSAAAAAAAGAAGSGAAGRAHCHGNAHAGAPPPPMHALANRPAPGADDPLVEDEDEAEARAAGDAGSEPSRQGSAADFAALEDEAVAG